MLFYQKIYNFAIRIYKPITNQSFIQVMQKFLSRFALLVTAAGLSAAVASCSDDDDKVIAPNMEPPTFNITVSEFSAHKPTSQFHQLKLPIMPIS